MTSVLISGWYGNGNLGDEALLTGMLRAIRAADPAIDPVVLSDDSARTAREHRVRARSRSGAGHRRRLLSEVRALPRYQGLVIGGGGLIKDFGPRPGNVHAWLRPGSAAASLRKPVMWYALGVDDVRHEVSRQAARRAAARARIVSVRDPGSARALRSFGVSREPIVTADPALLTAAPDRTWRAGEQTAIAVCPRRWKSTGPAVDRPGQEDALVSELASALDRLVERRGARVVLLPFRSVPEDDDVVVCRDLARRMRHAEAVRVLDVPRDAAAAAAVLAGCHLVVGTRLHSLVLALASAVPFYGLDYMPKVRFLAEHARLGSWTADLDAASTPGHLEREFEIALDMGFALREHLERVSAILRRLALLDGELLAALLRHPERLGPLEARARGLGGELRSMSAIEPAAA